MAAESAVLTMDSSRPEPRRRPQIVASSVLGMIMFTFTEAMLFAGMISAHAIVRARSAGQMWPPFGQPRLPIEQTAFNTTALLVSGIALVFAHFAYRKRPRQALGPLAIAALLGLFFVVFQGVEWVALLEQGLTLQSSAYGGFFYLIVGAHALHAVAAILCLTWAWFRLRRGALTPAQLGTVEVFWYFVVLVWPLIYLKVYLS
ncbi:MAG: heme-copper oxidase subunit III [Gemmatimonadetes bacterium]|nr:heme-copper oxidase subunit III [Gemmatimonadota bacterium]